ncbi:MAG: AAA family ATPase [Burkholderiaceae bacterium]
MLELRLLGQFRVLVDGQELRSLTRARSISLLACLSIAPNGILDRNWLAAMFWPASTHQQARTNLRREIHELRCLHPSIDACIRTNKTQVQWVEQASCGIDVREFEALVSRASSETDDGSRVRHLGAALGVYHGELLPGLNEPWVVARRDALDRQFHSAALALATLLTKAAQPGAATEVLERILSDDRLDETACAQLMRLHLEAGRTTQALRAYRATEMAIKQELGVAPGAELVALHRQAVNPHHGNDRFSAPSVEWAAPAGLIGRRHEWRRLAAMWPRSVAGQAQFCLVQGVSGIGKTRLVATFAESLSVHASTVASARCWDAASQAAFSAVAAWLKSLPLRRRRRGLDPRIWATVTTAMPALAGDHELRASGVAAGTATPPRERLLESIACLLAPADEPTLLVLDDIQWCDGDSLDALSHLLHHRPDSPLLVLATLRDEEARHDAPVNAFMTGLRRRDGMHRIVLDELDFEDTAALFAAECRRRSCEPLPASAIASFHRRFGGSPLVAVQWLQALADPVDPVVAPGAIESIAIPAAIADILATRIDRLAPAVRETAEIAAVAGNRVSAQVLAHAANLSAEEAGSRLDQLWRAHLMRDAEPGIFEFEHDAIRELLYQGIAPSTRSRWHRRIAEAMIAIDGAEADVNGMRIGHHFSNAGDQPTALDWTLRAAEAAEKRTGFGVAIEALERALGLLETAEPSARVIEHRSRLLLGIVNNATTAHGTSGEAVASAIERLSGLADMIQDPILKIQVLNRVRLHEMDRDLVRAQDTAKHVAALSTQSAVPVLRVEAHRALAAIHLLTGEFGMAEQLADTALAIYQAAIEAGEADAAAPSWPMLGALGIRALAAWVLGRAAVSKNTLGVLSTVSLLHIRPTDRAPILANAAELDAQWRRLPDLRRRVAALERAIEVPDNPLAVGVTNLYRGRLALLGGQAADAVDLLDDAQRQLVVERAGLLFESRCLLALAEALIASGRFERAMRVIERAQSGGEDRGERWWAAEFHRLRAWCLDRTGADDREVRIAYQFARALAREQGATTFLMRAWADEAAYHLQHGRLPGDIAELTDWANATGPGLAPPERLAWQRLRRRLAIR